MKKMKFLFALALTVCMLFTVAFAANEFIANDIKYSGTGNIDVTFSSDVYTTGYQLGAQVTFDTTKFEYVTSNSAQITYSSKKSRVNIVGASLASPLTFTLKPLGKDINGEKITFKNVQIALDGTIKYDGGTKVVTITTDTPVVNKYNVTFTGYESENRTDVEENTEITLPAAPAVDKNKEFVGWSDGTTTYEAGAKYTVTKEVTFTAVINDITLPTPVATKEDIISAEVDGKTYTDIFEGIYTLTPGKASLTKFGVKIPGKLNPADVREFATSGTFEGEGTFVYRVALFGVMDKADIAATPFAE